MLFRNSERSDTLLGELDVRHNVKKNNIDSDFLIDTNGFSTEGGVAHKRCVIHPCGQAWSVVYNVSWVEAGEGEGTTMMTTMTTIKTTTMTIINISMHIKMTTTNMSRSSRWPGFWV